MFGLLTNCIKSFGLAGLAIYLKIKLKQTSSLQLPGLTHPIHLRSLRADLISFKEIFIKKEYDIELPASIKPSVIIDAGANIGLTSVFFANKYPGAKIISIEPDKGNIDSLQKNTSHYKNITIIKGALWNKKELISIVDRGYGERGFMMEKKESNTLEAISINDILLDHNLTHIDILKIDIEGSEKEVFESNYENWLPKTKCIVIELHDRMKKGTSKSVFQAITQYDFSFSMRGENLIFINNDLVSGY